MKKRTTGIEWTEHTWNPFVGCTINSAGCTNCYAMREAARIEAFGNTPTYDGVTRVANGRTIWTGRINRATDATFRKPLKTREPSLFFVNSMSDFWHPAARDEWRREALEIMVRTPHQYQVLTKLPELITPTLERLGAELPENFWLGTTVERGDFAWRIDHLREVKARIRFLSIEPLIGPIGRLNLTGIHWVIVGGESGPDARRMLPLWVREVRDQCIEDGVPLFFKQWGVPRNNPIYSEFPTPVCAYEGSSRVRHLDPNGKGGSLLDGREWKEYPRFETQQPLIR